MIEDDAKADMLAEIEDYAGYARRQPGDVTLTEIAERLGVGRKTARIKANEMVAAGRWTTHLVFDNRQVRVWRKVS